jgi:hypothetical protein
MQNVLQYVTIYRITYLYFCHILRIVLHIVCHILHILLQIQHISLHVLHIEANRSGQGSVNGTAAGPALAPS